MKILEKIDKQLNEAAKAPGEWVKEPLYRDVIFATTKKEHDKALEKLIKAKGHVAAKNLLDLAAWLQEKSREIEKLR